MFKTNMSIESDAKGDIVLVVSEVGPRGQWKLIRHKVNLDEMFAVSSLLAGRIYGKAKRKK